MMSLLLIGKKLLEELSLSRKPLRQLKPNQNRLIRLAVIMRETFKYFLELQVN